jgi:uncharacterized protein
VEDPRGNLGRDLNDKIYAIDHYEKKLMKLIDGFHSEIAQKEALRRHQFMKLFVEQFFEDIQ